ncbi:MAG: hypothetical protein H6609_20335 [Ignavibacteriales bacterium]|nr:hypothetical protein [Ignavibacteriales bacterium]
MSKYFFICFFIFQSLFYSCKNNKNIDFNENGIYGAFFNDKYQKYFVGNGKGELFTFDYNLKLIDKKQFAYGPVATCISSSDNEYMINTSGDGTLYIWKVYQGSLSIYYKSKLHNSASMTCLFSPQMNYAVSTGHDSSVVVLDWKNKQILNRLKSPYGTIRFAWISYDDQYLIWADDNGYLFNTSIKTWKTIEKKVSHFAINCMVTNLNNSEIIIADEDGSIGILDFNTLNTKEKLKAHHGSAFVGELYDKDRLKIATSGNDGYLTFWARENNKYKLQKKIKAHNSPCCTLYYNDNCTQLLSGGQDGYIKIWDAETLELLQSKNIYE